MMADLIIAGDHFGCTALSSAAMPLKCGVDMDVPDITLNGFDSPTGPIGNGHAARTLTPGPMMSGFKMFGLAWLGPREEK